MSKKVSVPSILCLTNALKESCLGVGQSLYLILYATFET